MVATLSKVWRAGQLPPVAFPAGPLYGFFDILAGEVSERFSRFAVDRLAVLRLCGLLLPQSMIPWSESARGSASSPDVFLNQFDVAEFLSGSDLEVCACVGLAGFANSQALNVEVGVDSSPDLEPQNVRAHDLSTHGLSTWIGRWFHGFEPPDRIPKLMRLERKTIPDNGSF